MLLARPGRLAALARPLLTVARLPHRMARWAGPSHRSRGGAALRLVALLAALPGQAHAQRFDVDRPRPETTREPASPTATDAPAKPSGPPPQGWYGLGAVISDTAAASMIVLGGTQHYLWLLPGYLTFLIGAPINHAAHGQSTNAGISLGLRALPIAVTALILEPGSSQLVSDDQSCRGECQGLLAVALGAPALIAVFDDVYLSHHPESPGRKTAAAPSRTSFSWSPLVTPRREGGVSLGAVGQF